MESVPDPMTKAASACTTFEFTIVVTGVDPHAEDFADRFYEAGCDDALLSLQAGEVRLEFCREADRIETAFATAVRDVRRAGAQVVRIEGLPVPMQIDQEALLPAELNPDDLDALREAVAPSSAIALDRLLDDSAT